MELENMILSGKTQAQKVKHCNISPICGSQHQIFRLVCLTWYVCKHREARKGTQGTRGERP